MRREHLEEIAKVVEKHNLVVMSDEIYGELTYGKERHVSFADIPEMKERTVVISGFSKAYAMTGWRLGYALGPEQIISQMLKLHQYAIMSAPTTAQNAAIEALKHGDSDIERMRDEYDMRRRLIVDEFCRMGLTCFEMYSQAYRFPEWARRNFVKNSSMHRELRSFPEMHSVNAERVLQGYHIPTRSNIYKRLLKE